MLVLDRLRITIGGQQPVRNVSLSLDEGECVALLGPSGSGKSLTAAALGGYLPPRATATGSLRIHGKSADLGGRRREGVATVRQESLTALHPLVRLDRQILPALRRAHRGTSSSAAVSRAEDLLAEVGFADPARTLRSYPMELSGGQRQRVCLVQALASAPGILVADEPTTALDPVSRALVLAALQRAAAAGTGILLITHDAAAGTALCPRAVVLADAASVPAP